MVYVFSIVIPPFGEKCLRSVVIYQTFLFHRSLEITQTWFWTLKPSTGNMNLEYMSEEYDCSTNSNSMIIHTLPWRPQGKIRTCTYTLFNPITLHLTQILKALK